MKRFNFVLILSLFILAAFGCSSGSNAVTPDPEDNFFPISAAAATINTSITAGGIDVAGADTFLFNLDTGTLETQTMTNGMGISQFGIDPGQYMIVALTDTLYAEPVRINVVDESVIDLNITLDKAIFSTNTLYFGFVNNESDGTPVPMAKVSGGGVESYTDGYGFYILNAPASISELEASRVGFETLVIVPREGQYTDRNDYYSYEFFGLAPTTTTATTMKGFIRDASLGGELGGAFVSLLWIQQPGMPIITYLTNIDGRYNFFNLPLGQYSIAVRRDGYQAEANQVIINENDAIFNIYLTPDFNERGSLKGYVVTPDGNGIGSAQVIVSNPLLGKYSTWTDPATGYYFIDEIVPGDYTILALPPGTMYEPSTTFVTISDQDLTVSVSCPSPLTGVMTGIVTIQGQDPDALPPIGAKVVAEKIGSPFSGLTWTTHVDTQGRYTINGIYTGMYRVVATLDYDDELTYEGIADSIQISKGVITDADIEMS